MCQTKAPVLSFAFFYFNLIWMTISSVLMPLSSAPETTTQVLFAISGEGVNCLLHSASSL